MNPFDFKTMGPAFMESYAALWSGDADAFLKAGERASHAFLDGMKAMAAGKLPPEFAANADLAAAAETASKLWASAGQLSGALAARLPDSAASPADHVFRHMLDPATWLSAGGGDMTEALARMAEGPRFADLWDMERRVARVMAAWLALRRAALEHGAVTLEAWMRAGRTFSERLAATEPKPGRQAAIALWTDIANRELIETQRSKPFLATQAAMIRATTDLRVAQQDLVEQAGKQYGFPTRTELDDVHRTLTELRRELRALKRQARAPQASPQTPPVQAPATPATPAPPAPAAPAPRPRKSVRRQA